MPVTCPSPVWSQSLVLPLTERSSRRKRTGRATPSNAMHFRAGRASLELPNRNSPGEPAKPAISSSVRMAVAFPSEMQQLSSTPSRSLGRGKERRELPSHQPKRKASSHSARGLRGDASAGLRTSRLVESLVPVGFPGLEVQNPQDRRIIRLPRALLQLHLRQLLCS